MSMLRNGLVGKFAVLHASVRVTIETHGYVVVVIHYSELVRVYRY